MKQFFAGSPIVIFFHFAISVFVTDFIAFRANAAAIDAQIADIYAGAFGDAGLEASADRTLIPIFCAVAFLLLINIYNVTSHWTGRKRSEIRARMLSGGSPAAVCGQLLINYLVIITAASLAGIIAGGALLAFDFVVVDVHFFENISTIMPLSMLFVIIGGLAGSIAIRKTYNDFVRR